MSIKTIKLSECCVSISDGDHQPPPKTDCGIPFITISNVTEQNEIDFSDCMYVSEDYYSKLSDTRKARTGDILYTVVGSFGIPVLIRNDNRFVFQRHIAILRPNTNIVLPEYLYYILRTPSFYRIADAYAIGTAQRTIGLNSLRRIKVEIPSLSEQRKVVGYMSAFDNAIQNNSLRIKILEQMAEMLYKEWFVRFRFPGCEDAEFESGIPKGWKWEKLGNLCSISTGKCNREDAEADGEYPLFDRSQEIKRSNTWIKDCQAIIVPGEGTTFIPRYYEGKFNLHQRCYCVEPHNKHMGMFLLQTLMMNRRYFLSVATGATVPSLRHNNFTSMKILLPEKKLYERFDEIAMKMHLETEKYEKMNEQLAKQRDLLLPRLMSGKLQV